MTEDDVIATQDPAQIAAWRLLEAHENATHDGYMLATYPAEHIDELARAMHAARGIADAHCDNHTRARDLWTARTVLAPLRRRDNPIWRIEVLETNWRLSFCGNWMQNAEITGPPSDDETAILRRAEQLFGEGHIVQVVCDTPTRTVVWQSKLPWSATRVGLLSDQMIEGTWKASPDFDADMKVVIPASAGLRPGTWTPPAPPDHLDGHHRRAAAAATQRFADGTRVYHLRRRQWGTVDGEQQNTTSTWVHFDGEQDPIEANNEFLRLTQPVPNLPDDIP